MAFKLFMPLSKTAPLIARTARIAKRIGHGFSRFMSSRLERSRTITQTNSTERAEEAGESVVEVQPEMVNGVPLPPAPTQCCNSGCPNCVWIKYAQELTAMFDDGDAIAKNKIIEKVSDPKLRTYLLTQLGLEKGDEENKC